MTLRGSIDTFLQALNSLQANRTHFSVKVAFRDGDAVEYMWLNDVDHQAGTFLGSVGNVPEVVASVSFGQAVTVPVSQIADWMFVEDGRLKGGYTIRLMRERLSPEERAEFDENIGFTMD